MCWQFPAGSLRIKNKIEQFESLNFISLRHRRNRTFGCTSFVVQQRPCNQKIQTFTSEAHLQHQMAKQKNTKDEDLWKRAGQDPVTWRLCGGSGAGSGTPSGHHAVSSTTSRAVRGGEADVAFAGCETGTELKQHETNWNRITKRKTQNFMAWGLSLAYAPHWAMDLSKYFTHSYHKNANLVIKTVLKVNTFSWSGRVL